MLCKWIRSQTFPWYVYVILLNDPARSDRILEGLAAGSDEFLIKSVSPASLGYGSGLRNEYCPWNRIG
ncbi:MAG: hypothetical protein ACUVWX_09895 [Kiritimatiellia bacterium]